MANWPATWRQPSPGCAVVAQESSAAVVSNSTVQPFGINGQVDIDFNSDGQVDFQIDHDRVDLNGTDLDYLQVDKNDASSAADPLPIDNFAGFPNNGLTYNKDHKYLTDGGTNGGDQGEYVAALDFGASIGPASSGVWEFQEGANFNSSGGYRRPNRLIDEDNGQIDSTLGGFTINPTPGSARFLGLGGEVKYVGVAIDLQDAGYPGNTYPTVNGPNDMDDPLNYWYGWIGVRITNEADATGEVVGYAYENQLGVAISAGDVGTPMGLDGDYNGNNIIDAADYTTWRDAMTAGATSLTNDHTPGVVDESDFTYWRSHFGESLGAGSARSVAVPEPASIVMAAVGSFTLVGALIVRKWFGRDKT